MWIILLFIGVGKYLPKYLVITYPLTRKTTYLQITCPYIFWNEFYEILLRKTIQSQWSEQCWLNWNKSQLLFLHNNKQRKIAWFVFHYRLHIKMSINSIKKGRGNYQKFKKQEKKPCYYYLGALTFNVLFHQTKLRL